MTSNSCDEFVEAIRRNYSFLFDDFGFQLIHRDERANGRYCMVVLESEAARVKMELEPGIPLVYVGQSDTPICWSIDQDFKAKRQWWVLGQVLGFMGGADPTEPMKLPPATERWPSVDETMEEVAGIWRPHAAEMFRALGPEPPKGWWRAYAEYRDLAGKAVERQMRRAGWHDNRSAPTKLLDAIRGLFRR